MARGEIKKLSDLFEGYRQRLIAPERTVVETFLEVVKDILGMNVPPRIVRYTPANKTLTISGGTFRSEIKLHEKELLEHVAGRLGPKNAPKRIA